MSQATVVVGALMAGFFLYLAANGKLSTYLGFLFGSSGSPIASAISAATSVASAAGAVGAVA